MLISQPSRIVTCPGHFCPNGPAMTDQELFCNYHEREALRLRSLIATATTPALKARLLKETETHEELAGEVEDLKTAAVS